MSNNHPRGPWFHRFLIWLFTIGVSVLSFWLLGYIVRDIDTIEGPDYQTFESSMLDKDLTTRRAALAEQIDGIEREIRNVDQRQTLLQNTIRTSQQTMHQLLDLQRLSLEKGTELSDEQSTALTENLDLFLANQTQVQAFNTQLSELNLQLQSLQSNAEQLDKQIEAAQIPIRKAFSDAAIEHRWRLGAAKLAVLLPLLLIAAFIFVRKSAGNYAMLVYATSAALAARVLLVMHEHFPAIYFRYILIIVSLAIAVGILIRLLRTIAKPQGEWLLKQYREAYTNFMCPICEFPIRRGPLRYVLWTPRSLRKLFARQPLDPEGTSDDPPYTCPSCGTTLFDRCGKCQATRYALLPACDKCGVTENHNLPEPK
ncbi:MAG: hypothetical protein R3C05_20155 [Pirellulaceae bacterium]